jgi:hypothetical protein
MLDFASRSASGFWCVKANQADVRLAIIQADGVAVDDVDGNSRSRLGF